MHEITWCWGKRRRASLYPDGLCSPPPGWPRATWIVADGHTATLVDGACRCRLAPEVTISTPGAEGSVVTWRPQANERCQPLGVEQTELEPDQSCEVKLFLSNGEEELELSEELTLVGRHPACDLRVDDARASTWHCAIRRTTGGVRLLDLDSTNGTWVDGARVSAALLHQRANLEVGGRRLLLRPAVPSPIRVRLGSHAMRQLDAIVTRIAPTDASVLIHGETGVGKDELARQLHERSGRRGPLIALNAAAIAPALASSELFGHVSGAFTGADRDHDGAFLAAHGGTLFLDEVAELPFTTQAELLRVVELKRVRRIGELDETPVDVRLVAATHVDLVAAVRDGSFREDLFHRLCVVPLTVPPLRNRPDDLRQLAEHFITAQPSPRRLSPAAWELLLAHPWPGNIRELFNVLWRACVTTDDDPLEPDALELSPIANGPKLNAVRARVVETYNALGQSVAATARELGMNRATIYRHLKNSRTSTHIER